VQVTVEGERERPKDPRCGLRPRRASTPDPFPRREGRPRSRANRGMGRGGSFSPPARARAVAAPLASVFTRLPEIGSTLSSSRSQALATRCSSFTRPHTQLIVMPVPGRCPAASSAGARGRRPDARCLRGGRPVRLDGVVRAQRALANLRPHAASLCGFQHVLTAGVDDARAELSLCLACIGSHGSGSATSAPPDRSTSVGSAPGRHAFGGAPRPALRSRAARFSAHLAPVGAHAIPKLRVPVRVPHASRDRRSPSRRSRRSAGRGTARSRFSSPTRGPLARARSLRVAPFCAARAPAFPFL
jgi:hypothetical protein